MQFEGLTPVPFHHVRVDSSFWSPRIDTIRKVTAQVCLKQCEDTGRVANFRRAAGLEPGGFQGIYFNDSDVYKVLEGVAYVLMGGADPELEAQADAVIDAICASQQPDGYLFSYYTLTDPAKRFTDMGYHEAYCLGHMIEGAVAYAQATGKDKWVKAAMRAVDYMMSVIGPGKRHWVTGHQELELALVKLYRYTGEQKYLDYAGWIIDERGHGHLDSPDFFRQNFHESYCQDDLPARELTKVTGHAVRAMYYYTGMADVAALTQDEGLAAALIRLWNNVVPANLYITGGIGQDAAHEGFTRDWHLPNLTAYCETCAAIGMALWNQRMNLMTGEAKYADLVECELYNGALAGISLSGDRFFYVNPLASVGKHHRQEWFGCSCCPTNLIRFIPSVGGYAYAVKDQALYVNQFIGGEARIPAPQGEALLSVETRYPWEGMVRIRVVRAAGLSCLKVRKPGWCEQAQVMLNGQPLSAGCVRGYLEVAVSEGDELIVDFEMPIRRAYADERVKECEGRVAFLRGPVLYCAEETDNPGMPSEYFHADFAVSCEAQPQGGLEPELLGGVYALQVGGARLVPYYAWDNREAGAMVVWIKEV